MCNRRTFLKDCRSCRTDLHLLKFHQERSSQIQNRLHCALYSYWWLDCLQGILEWGRGYYTQGKIALLQPSPCLQASVIRPIWRKNIQKISNLKNIAFTDPYWSPNEVSVSLMVLLGDSWRIKKIKTFLPFQRCYDYQGIHNERCKGSDIKP